MLWLLLATVLAYFWIEVVFRSQARFRFIEVKEHPDYHRINQLDPLLNDIHTLFFAGNGSCFAQVIDLTGNAVYTDQIRF